jgi:hypothetical protein
MDSIFGSISAMSVMSAISIFIEVLKSFKNLSKLALVLLALLGNMLLVGGYHLVTGDFTALRVFEAFVYSILGWGFSTGFYELAIKRVRESFGF